MRCPNSPGSLLCHRCGVELEPGRGDLYVVNIEALADPYDPRITAQDLQADIDAEIRKAIADAQKLSTPELMDHVYRRLTIHLCGPCYRLWIENPAGP